MITVPGAAMGSPSPSILTSILRIVLKRNVKVYVSRLIMAQRLGSLSKLIHKCTKTTKGKKNAQRETTTANLAHRMIDYGWHINDTPDRKPVIIYLPLRG